MINLALIGVGNWGRNFITTVNNLGDCKIKYVCSKTDKNLKLLKGNFFKTTNYKELFKFSDIHGVIIATSGSTHFEIAKEFLKKGFNLLIEKPLALNYSDALILKSLKEKTGAKVLVGHVYLFDPAYIATKELFNKLGEIRYISYESVNNGPYRDDMSILWDMGPHPISILLDLYQQEPLQIRAWALDKLRPKKNLLDIVFMRLKFLDGSEVFIKISWLSPFKRRELIIVGNKEAIVYNDLEEKKVTYYKNTGPKIINGDAIKTNSEREYPSYGSETPLQMEIKEFVEAIKENREIKKSDLDFGVRVTRLLEAAEQSINDNDKVIEI